MFVVLVRRSLLIVGLTALLGCAIGACAGGDDPELNPQPLPPNQNTGQKQGDDDDGTGAANAGGPSGDTTTTPSTGGSSSSSGDNGSSGSSGSSGASPPSDGGVDGSDR